jgi:hypothetical protein
MTTTDLLTFFQPGRTAGTMWAFSCPAAHTPREAWVYLPGDADLSRFATREISSEEQFNRFLAEIRAAIQERGGLLVEARVHNEIIKVSLEGQERNGYAGPRKMLRLRASGDPRLEAIPQSVDLMAGDHLILPVSAAAQQRLETFDEVFEGFPEDVRSTILNVLRRPSLEWRINRLEQILSMPPATPADWEKSRLRNRGSETFLEKLSRWFMWRLPVGAVAITLLLAAGAVAGFNRLFGDAPEAKQAGDTSDGAGSAAAATAPAGTPPENSNPAEQPLADSGGNSPTPDPEAEAEVKESLGELFKALEDSENASIKTLYDSHFKDYTGNVFGGGSPVVWGLAKLEALRLGLIQETDPLLGNAEIRTAVKNVFSDPAKGRALTDDANALALLAWSSCQRYGQPALLVKDGDTAPFQLATGRDCGKITSENAIAGLEDVTEWVKDKKS